jgi:hypothetical protein
MDQKNKEHDYNKASRIFQRMNEEYLFLLTSMGQPEYHIPAVIAYPRLQRYNWMRHLSSPDSP